MRRGKCIARCDAATLDVGFRQRSQDPRHDSACQDCHDDAPGAKRRIGRPTSHFRLPTGRADGLRPLARLRLACSRIGIALPEPGGRGRQMRRQNRASVPDSLIDLSLRQTLRQSQVGAGKIRAIEARAAESGIHQPRTTEVGVLQPRVRKVHFREHGAHQVRFDERRLIQARPAKFCEAKIDRTTLDAAELAFGYRNVEIIQHRDDTRILTPPGIPGAGARTQHLDVRRIRCRLRPPTRPRRW